jgi:hypothetical protein
MRRSLSLPIPRRGPRRTGPAPLPSRALLVVPQTSAAPSPTAVTRAVEAADGGPVTVMTVLRIHGSGLGVPHPGLLPNAGERERGRLAIAAAIEALEARKVEARGEIAVTRAEARAIARTARAVGAATVILDLPEPHGLRRLIEGDLVAQLRRRLRGHAIVGLGSQ